VRLSRSRFWRNDDAADKRAAYDALWYGLVQVVRCMAPVMPFLADELWQNLVRGVCEDAPPSVHLSAYPGSDPALADAELVASMASARTVVALGHGARNDAGIKLRQPLAAATVVTADRRRRDHLTAHADLVAAELGVKQVRLADSSEEFAQVEVMPNLRVLGPKYGRDLGMIRGLLQEGDFTVKDGHVDVGHWTLEPGEFELRTRAREGFAVVDGDGFAVALDTEITPELRVEGVARDVIRQVQELRKQAGLEVADRIALTYPAGEPEVAEAFAQHGERIAREVLAVRVTAGDGWRVERA
jgi:isoleucyl-tRNA synthetase